MVTGFEELDPETDRSRPWSPRTLEAWLVHAIILHSALVGIGLVVLPRAVLPLVGWGRVEPLFFVWQGGVFHVVVAIGYLLEYRRHGTVWLLVSAKSIATVFLVSASLLADVPWVVPFSGVTDGLMGLAAYLLHVRARASQGSVDQR